MNEERILRKLSAAASGDSPPPIDVTDSVMGNLPAAAESKGTLLWTFATVSSAAAAVLAAVALYVLSAQAARQDAISDFLQSTLAVMQ